MSHTLKEKLSAVFSRLLKDIVALNMHGYKSQLLLTRGDSHGL